MRLVQVYYMSVNGTGVIQLLYGRFLGFQMSFCRFLSFFGEALYRDFKIFKNEYPNPL